MAEVRVVARVVVREVVGGRLLVCVCVNCAANHSTTGWSVSNNNDVQQFFRRRGYVWLRVSVCVCVVCVRALEYRRQRVRE